MVIHTIGAAMALAKPVGPGRTADDCPGRVPRHPPSRPTEGVEETEKAVEVTQEVSKAKQVLLDTNAVFRYKEASPLIEEGETPVISQTVEEEIADVSSRPTSKFGGGIPSNLGRIPDDVDLAGRVRAMRTLRGFGAKLQGLAGDGAVVATAVGRNIPVITADRPRISGCLEAWRSGEVTRVTGHGIQLPSVYPGVQIGTLGTIDRQDGQIVLRKPDDDVVPLGTFVEEVSNLRGWFDEISGLLILGDNSGDQLLVVGSECRDVLTRVRLERDPDPGLRRMNFFELGDTMVCCLTEMDILSVAADGSLCWFQTHNDLSLSLVEVTDTTIHLESGMPDLQDWHPIYLDVKTGREVGPEHSRPDPDG